MRNFADPGPRVLRVLGRVIGLAAVVACVATAGASAAVRANQYGVVSAINGFSLMHYGPAWGQQLPAIRANGVQEVRSDAVWTPSQPASMDSWVTALANNRLTWQPVIDYSFDGGAWSDVTGYAAAAQVFATRYGPGGTFWAQHPKLPYLPVQTYELGNEEDGSQWNIPAQPYGALYLAVHTAIHAVNPSASVVVGGLSEYNGPYDPSQDQPSSYLVQLFGYYPQLTGIVDGYALHPYAADAWASAQWVWSFRHTLTNYGVPKSVPIDLTEFGWPYSASNESWRGSQMNSFGSAFARSNCGIREVAPYDWINPTKDGMNDTDFGFVDPSATNTTLRPAGTAWFTGLAVGSTESKWVFCP